MATYGIIRNDDERTVCFSVGLWPKNAAERRPAEIDGVPFAQVGATIARLVAAGHRVEVTKAARRKLVAAGADLSGAGDVTG